MTSSERKIIRFIVNDESKMINIRTNMVVIEIDNAVFCWLHYRILAQ